MKRLSLLGLLLGLVIIAGVQAATIGGGGSSGGGGTQYAEDTAHSSGDTGTMALCVRRDANTTLADTTGDYAPCQTDANGNLKVNVVAGGGTGGVSVAEDTAHSAGENITPIGCRRIDSEATSAGTSGDWATVDCDASGRVRTNTEMPDAAALADNTANPTVPAVAAFIMCYDGSTWDRCQGGLTDTDDGSIAASQVPNLGVTLDYVYSGTAWVRNIVDPCSRLAKTHIAINISTATTTELTSALAGASTYYYVCSIDLITAGANNVALVDDDTDNCASVTAGLAGGTTAASGWNFAANGGLVKGNGNGTVYKAVTANSVLCLVTSAATQLSGSIQVVAAP